MLPATDEWIKIPGPLGDTYEVTPSGKVRMRPDYRGHSTGKRKPGEEISQTRNSSGGVSVALRHPITGKSSTISVNTLIGLVFLGKRDMKKFRVIHKNGNKLDNSVDNLEWAAFRIEQNFKKARG